MSNTNWNDTLIESLEQRHAAEVRELKRKLKHIGREFGKSANTIFILRGEVALLRNRHGLGDYYDTLDNQAAEIRRLLERKRRAQAREQIAECRESRLGLVSCAQEMWTGHGCLCAVMELEPDVVDEDEAW